MQAIPITAITSFVAQRWRLDTTMTLFLSQIIAWIITLNVWDWPKSDVLAWLPWWWVSLPIAVACVYFGYRAWMAYRWITLSIYDTRLIRTINNYIREYPDLVERTSQIVGTPQQLKTVLEPQIPNVWANMTVDKYQCQIRLDYVQRPILIDVANGTTTTQKETREYVALVNIRISNLDIPVTKFLKMFPKLVRNQQTQNTKVRLTGHQIKSIEKHEVTWISTLIHRELRSVDPNTHLASYFYKDRDRLIQSVQSTIDRKESWNAILHGPPGTGKSSFITTLAKYFRRGIYSVDLRLISRGQLLQILSDHHRTDIIVLDEFDRTVEFLVEHEKPQTSTVNVNNQVITTESKPDLNDLRLHDLLGIFQGPIPYPSMIMVATTNNLEYIRKQSEALVRPGRLTPWLIDYIDTAVLHQIIAHYFPDTDATPDLILPESHTIPTSLILDYAKSSLGDYERFRQLMQAQLK